MKLLQDRILKDGKVYPGDILKIDSFLNHQIDIKLMDEIGKEFKRLFSDLHPTKILTIESSGIAIATATSAYFDYVPVVFAKKNKSLNMSDAYIEKEKSYTRDEYYTVSVAKEYLNENDKILIIDDFLANGEALNSMISICKQAKAEILAAGIVVCKTYQPGEMRIKSMGIRLECLARIASLNNNQIKFEQSGRD